MKPTPIKRILLVLAVLAALLLLMATLAQAQPVQVTDDRGRVVKLAAPPQRIVSLLPSLTETVCALGECQRLVGVDRFSNWPGSIAAVPRSFSAASSPAVNTISKSRPNWLTFLTYWLIESAMLGSGMMFAKPAGRLGINRKSWGV